MEKKHRSSYGDKKAKILEMLEQGTSYHAIAKVVHCSLSTVAYHAKQNGHIADELASKRYDWESVQRYQDEGHSAKECAEQFGFSMSAWSDAVKSGRVVKSEYAMPIETLLVSDRKQTNRTHLKQRLIRLGMLISVCATCGISEWMGKPLMLELDHINGKNNDNRIDNLRLLCPNCHSQTLTYCNKCDLL